VLAAEQMFNTDNLWTDSTGYSIQFQACESDLTPDELWTYGQHYPYDTIQTVKGDSLLVSFDFVANCCLTFSGRPELSQDTLILKYGLDRVYTESCGCSCEYQLTYRMDTKGRDLTAIRIVYSEEIFGK
jgi:hypothetical protein